MTKAWLIDRQRVRNIDKLLIWQNLDMSKVDIMLGQTQKYPPEIIISVMRGVTTGYTLS